MFTAEVETVIIDEDGSGRLELILDLDEPGWIFGNPTFSSAPEEITALNGLTIKGTKTEILLGEEPIACRDTETKITFVGPKRFKQAVVKYHKERKKHGVV